jgi:hypothetical protein
VSSSIYTIKRNQYERNIKLVFDYEKERDMNHREFARLCGINHNTFGAITSGRFYGTIYTWRRVKAATSLPIEYDQIICDSIPPKMSRNEVFVKEYILRHLEMFGNVFIHRSRVKQMGGEEKLLNALRAYGINCKLQKNENDNNFVLEVISEELVE